MCPLTKQLQLNTTMLYCAISFGINECREQYHTSLCGRMQSVTETLLLQLWQCSWITRVAPKLCPFICEAHRRHLLIQHIYLSVENIPPQQHVYLLDEEGGAPQHTTHMLCETMILAKAQFLSPCRISMLPIKLSHAAALLSFTSVVVWLQASLLSASHAIRTGHMIMISGVMDLWTHRALHLIAQ